MSNEVAEIAEHPLTANAVVARVRLIQEIMTRVMKKNTHYGIISGCQKPSLWKPGAEQLLVTFRIAPDAPIVQDLSTSDAIRYRVTRIGRNPNGGMVAAGVGECSSDEEKYKWRRPVSNAEFDAMPEDHKRIKYKRDGEEKQVRTNPADIANTILKMADKRAFVAMSLLATAASDIFTQDLEDMPEEVVQSIEGAEFKEPIQPPKEKKPASKEGTQYITFVPAARSTKATSTGKPKWSIKSPEGEWYSTLNEAEGVKAIAAGENKKSIKVGYVISGDFKNIVSVEDAA